MYETVLLHMHCMLSCPSAAPLTHRVPGGTVFTQEAHYSCWLPRQVSVIELLLGCPTTSGTTNHASSLVNQAVFMNTYMYV